ncbi:MAG: hypothetical protein PQJ50_03120 [Spirochaetales bacterium]|nr:hypothetical protein [Spirochaetales bacterium]
MKTKTLITAVFLVSFLSSCASFGILTKPKSEESSLIYGYIDKVTEVNYYKKNYIYAMKWEKAEEIAALQNKVSETGEWYLLNRELSDNPFIFMNGNSGVFAIPVHEPGEYYICSVALEYPRSPSVLVTEHFPISPYESKDNVLNLKGGDMQYWGAVEFTLTEDPRTSQILPHPTMTKEEVLDLLEKELEGSGWEDWIEAEKNRLQIN